MSSVASVSRGGAPSHARGVLSIPAPRIHATSNQLLAFAFAALLVLFAFVTGGGVDLAANTWAEIVLLVLAGGLAAAAVILKARPAALTSISLALFAALAVLTAASVAWSVQPENSFTEAGRTGSYLAAFGGAIVLSRVFPRRRAALIGGLATAATLLCAYALLVKVFPGTLDRSDPIARLKAPFDYWNAVGLIAAMGLPACLWGGSERGARPLLRALCVPAIATLVTALLLSYSRSALLAAVVALAVWFAFARTRLRAALLLSLGLAGGALLTIWALGTHPLTHDGATLAARTAAGHSFGVLLALTLATLFVIGFAAAFASDRARLAADTRRTVGTVLIVLVALVPVGGLAAVAASSRGLTGGISHTWHSLTNSTQVTGDVPGRLVEFANTRPRYWSEALRVGEHAPLGGVGAGGYGTARTRYTNDPWLVQHAHSYVVETFADLGLIGLAVNIALLVVWALAAARTLRAAREQPRRGERGAMLTLLCVVVAFGVSSAIDWTWFIPGTAVPALLCAGWLAGRAPLARQRGSEHPREPLLGRPGALGALTAIAFVVLLTGWAVWQPLRSADADSAAVTALARGDSKAAIADAEAAAARDPVAVEPLWELSAIDSGLGNAPRAIGELRQATTRQPENPETWRQLGLYELEHHEPRVALTALHRALVLDRGSDPTITWIQQAQSQLRTGSSS